MAEKMFVLYACSLAARLKHCISLDADCSLPGQQHCLIVVLSQVCDHTRHAEECSDVQAH